MIRTLQEAAFRFPPVRLLVGLFFLARGTWFRLTGDEYRFLSDYCWIARVADVWPLTGHARGVVMAAARRLPSGRNTLVDSYRANPASQACAELYTITGKGKHDLLRDLIVLKAATPAEKGVILLKYVRTFDAVVALFDLGRLMERYTFVLEPCWAGYWDPSLLMFLHRDNPVFVQCFTADDLAFITDIGAPFVPVKLGPADWVNADLFEPPAGQEKRYDLVMVANWAPHKRHALLFEALDAIDRPLSVLLIGFPLAGYTADTIRQRAARIRNPGIRVEVLESLPAHEVAKYVSRARVFVFLSRKEGDNKALVEAMFADVPSIVYRDTVGGASSRVNASTGVFSSDADLSRTILDVLGRYTDFSPRAWALENTGSAVSTARLDALIASVMTAQGGTWREGLTEKTNSPNLAYRDPDVRSRFESDYAFVLASRR